MMAEINEKVKKVQEIIKNTQDLKKM